MTIDLFFKYTATAEIYPLSLHDALPILIVAAELANRRDMSVYATRNALNDLAYAVFNKCSIYSVLVAPFFAFLRSEEHTSELQSLRHLVCRLLLEKKKQ